MADAEKNEDKKVEVSEKVLIALQEQIAKLESKVEDEAGKRAGLEEIVAKGASTEGEPKLREKKNFEPKFRTVKIRKYPIAGNIDNMGYVIGWTNRGAYEEVDKSGVSPQIVNFIDVIFLGQEKKNGKIQAEKIKLLDLLNKGIQVHSKIVEVKKEPRQEVTGEEIDVTVWDPQHGLTTTGDKIDGYVMFTDLQYKVQIPGVAEPVWIDAEFCN